MTGTGRKQGAASSVRPARTWLLCSGPRVLRHPQSLSLQQRSPDGGAEPARRLARGDDARRAGGADALHAPRRDGADRGVYAAGHQRRDQSRPSGRRRASSITCTCISCRAGPAIPASSRSSATCACCPRSSARRPSGCGRSSSGWPEKKKGGNGRGRDERRERAGAQRTRPSSVTRGQVLIGPRAGPFLRVWPHLLSV